MEQLKQCLICREFKLRTLEFFYKRNTKDGFHPYCKPCASKKSRKWEIENPEQYKAANQKKIQSKDPLRRLRSKIAAEKNRKDGYQKEWRQNNPDKVKASVTKYSNKKHNITMQEWDACRLYFDYRCAYCGLTWEENKKLYNQDLHKEHVDHNGADDLSNCIPSCKSCNSSKHEYTFEHWYNSNSENFTQERMSKITKWLDSDYKHFIKNQ